MTVDVLTPVFRRVAAPLVAVLWTIVWAMGPVWPARASATHPPGLPDWLAQSTAAEPPIVARLLGEWRGRGVVTGRESTIAMTWERAVGGAFLELRFRNAMAASATRPAEVFEGRGFYRFGPGPAAGTGMWLDTRGLLLPVRMTVADDAFTSDWGTEATEAGRTVYRLVDLGTLEVVDSVRRADGQFLEFGRSRLTR